MCTGYCALVVCVKSSAAEDSFVKPMSRLWYNPHVLRVMKRSMLSVVVVVF